MLLHSDNNKDSGVEKLRLYLALQNHVDGFPRLKTKQAIARKSGVLLKRGVVYASSDSCELRQARRCAANKHNKLAPILQSVFPH